MYTPICILLLTGMVFLSFLHLRGRRTWLTVTEGILSGTGFLLFPLTLFRLHTALAGQTDVFSAWVRDSMAAYLRYALPALGIFLALTVFCALSALWEKKYRSPLWIRPRMLTSLACSVVLLALAAFFGALSATETVPLAGCIYALGIAGALLLRAMYLAEALWERKYN